MRPAFAGKILLFWCAVTFRAGQADSAELLPVSKPPLTVWWAPSSSAKLQPDTPAPGNTGSAMRLYCARNEREAAQLIIRPAAPVSALTVGCDGLQGPRGSSIQSSNIDLLRVMYLGVAKASDPSSKPGLWPDPLLPVGAPVNLEPETNHIFWVRVFVPKEASAGLYKGSVRLRAAEISLEVPLELTVYDFALPDQTTCTTAFGFSAGEVFAYHALRTEEQKRAVLDLYLADLAAHHISPYDPTPLDPIEVTWPDVKPPRSAWDDWTGLRIVTNEVHRGTGALLVYDDQPAANVTVTYEPLIPISREGFRFKAWYRTAVPGHRFNISFNHYNANKEWMSGRNNDLTLSGSGTWQEIERVFTNFPAGAGFVRLHLRATAWTEQGENLGLVWFDDVSLSDLETGRELLTGGDFERKPRTELVAAPDKLRVRFDFRSWDREMERVLKTYHFNSFQVHFPGLGGGTFHSIEGPSLLGFHENDPEYPLLMRSYGEQLENHLRERGWLDKAFVYWFDEPSPDQYAFVMNGFAKLKRYAPGLTRMLTEKVAPGLIGGPNLWCPISNNYNQEQADARRQYGEKFWWYVCTGPKAPYTGLFIDHPAPEMRIWAWQTWQRGINGLLVWQLNYWTSSAAYPEPLQPQNPYEDPMSWTSGYSTPAGQRLPWGNGDGRFIYPPTEAAAAHPAAPVLAGPVDSIRWEQLRDGIEDYEYMVVLRKRLNAAKSRLSASDVQELERLLQVPAEITRSLTDFTKDGAPIEKHRRAVAEAIQRL